MAGVEFNLVDYQRKDFEALWVIDQECFPAGIAYSRQELDAYIRQWGSFTLVAKSALEAKKSALPKARTKKNNGDEIDSIASILGFLVAAANRQKVGHIITIDVLPQARRLGLGSKLLSAAEDRLRLAGCHSVYLETAVDNQAAIAFYKRHQYFVVKTVRQYYANEVDALVLQKDLLSVAEAS